MVQSLLGCAIGPSEPLPHYNLFCSRPIGQDWNVIRAVCQILKQLLTAVNTVTTVLLGIFPLINLYLPEFSYRQNPKNMQPHSRTLLHEVFETR